MLAACRNTGDENSVGGLLKLEEQYPGSLKILEMDVTDREMTEKAALQVQQEFGHIDFLVNNAGVLFEKMVMPGDAIADLDVEKFRKTLDVNVTGTAIVLKYFIRLLYASEDACIMNITSEAGHLSPQATTIWHILCQSMRQICTPRRYGTIWQRSRQTGICGST